MTSYLENRSQYVSLSGENSSIKHMQYNVPQGSILGPLLFIIHINDIPNIFNRAKFILYADDANIIIKTLKSKMSRYIGILCKIKILLPIQAKMQIFQSLIQSHLNYCSCIQDTLSSRARLA